VRIGLVGTDLACVATPFGGLEKLLVGWARNASVAFDIVLIDVAPEGHTHYEPNGMTMFRHVGMDFRQVERDLQLDVVHTNNRPFWVNDLATRVNTSHNFPDAWGARSRTDTGVSWVSSRTIHTAVSSALARTTARELGLEKSAVCITPPFVDPAFFDQLHTGGGGLLFPGRLMDKKGVAVVLEACDRAGITSETTFVDITTDHLRQSDEYLRLREATVSAGARLVPRMDSPVEVARQFAAADTVIAVATQPEGLGLVVLEAQAVDTAVVTAGPGGLREATLRPNVHLRNLEPGSLAVHLQRSLRDKTGRGTKARIAQRYSLEESLAAMERVWTRL
jgi:glycosyltransferase involved in cell wall biosynthesis